MDTSDIIRRMAWKAAQTENLKQRDQIASKLAETVLFLPHDFPLPKIVYTVLRDHNLRHTVP